MNILFVCCFYSSTVVIKNLNLSHLSSLQSTAAKIIATFSLCPSHLLLSSFHWTHPLLHPTQTTVFIDMVLPSPFLPNISSLIPHTDVSPHLHSANDTSLGYPFTNISNVDLYCLLVPFLGGR